MKYKKTPKYKKIVKHTSMFLSDTSKLVKLRKNPIKTIFHMLIQKGSNIDTRRKRIGMVKNKDQFYNSRTKRWVVRNRKTGRIERQSSRKGMPYKGIRKI